jgi:hypothetical protein
MREEDEVPDFQLLERLLDRRALLEGCLLGGTAMVAGAAFGGLGFAPAATAAPVAAAAASAGQQAAKERLLSGRAWDDFCDTLRTAGHMIDRWGKEPSELERAEWYRFMTRVCRNGFERFVENCEPDRPRLRDATWRQSINFQNPDQDHLLTEFVDGRHEYRITGQRGTVPYFVLGAWRSAQPADLGARDWAARGVEGLKEFDPATLKTTAFLQSDTMKFEPDGSFEIILSQKKHAGNWLQLQPDTTGVLVRVVYHERQREQAPQMKIERLDGAAPRPITPEDMSIGLAKAGQTVLGYSELVRAWWQDNLAKRPNRLRFSMTTYLSNGGVADREHGFGAWQKAPGQALVIEFTPPACEYWIFQLCNRWQENLDNYEDGQGYVTKFTVKPEADGRVRIVIAERDPGIGGNWVDPYGHDTGGMSLRLIKTEGAPVVTTHLVELAELTRLGWDSLNENTAITSGEVVR